MNNKLAYIEHELNRIKQDCKTASYIVINEIYRAEFERQVKKHTIYFDKNSISNELRLMNIPVIYSSLIDGIFKII